jgi:hypothetical protein
MSYNSRMLLVYTAPGGQLSFNREEISIPGQHERASRIIGLYRLIITQESAWRYDTLVPFLKTNSLKPVQGCIKLKARQFAGPCGDG